MHNYTPDQKRKINYWINEMSLVVKLGGGTSQVVEGIDKTNNCKVNEVERKHNQL
jgi:hypothetical protein